MKKGLMLTKPNAKPNEVNQIGVSDNFKRNPINEERAKHVQDIIAKENNIAEVEYAPSKENELINQTVKQNYTEQILPRKLLDPAPSEWNFFTPPNDETRDMLLNSIYRDGLLSPIIVWKKSDGRYMILSGHTRESCYDELFQTFEDPKYLQIPCRVYEENEIDEVDAKRIIIVSNVAQRGKQNTRDTIRSIGELAKIEKVNTKHGDGKEVAVSVAKLAKVGKTTVFFYKKVNNLIDPLLEMFCNGQLSRRAADVLATKGRILQEHIYENEYIELLTPYKLKKIKNAQEIEEIDSIILENDPPERFSYSINLDKKLSRNTKLLGLLVDKKEYDALVDTITDALTINKHNLSEKTIKLITERLKA